MSSSTIETADVGFAIGDVDPVEEMQMRTWARRNYVSADRRDGDWHPVVLDEMQRADRELR